MELALRTRDTTMISTDVGVICTAVLSTHRLRRVDVLEQGLEIVQRIVEQKRYSRFMLPVVAMYQGWVHAQRGLLEQGIAEMR